MGRLGDDITRLRREIADWQENRETLIGGLKDNRTRIQRDVGRMQEQFREHRNVEATKTRREIGEFRRKITDDVKALRKKNAQWKTRMPDLSGHWERMREVIHRDMAEISRQGASERAAFVSGIRQYLNELQQEFTASRHIIVDELDDLRRAWHGAAAVEQELSAVDLQEGGEPQPIKDPVFADPTGGEEEGDDVASQSSFEAASFSVSDDLTMITGIAQERQHQLHAVGIATFEELSALSAKELQVMLGKPISRDEIQRWIDQAKELTGL